MTSIFGGAVVGREFLGGVCRPGGDVDSGGLALHQRHTRAERFSTRVSVHIPALLTMMSSPSSS